MRYNILYILLCCVLFSFTTTAQQLDHVLGEILLKPTHSKGIDQILTDVRLFQGKKNAASATTQQLVGGNMNIWKIDFDHTVIHERTLLAYLRQHPLVEVAQFNHLIVERAEPDDPFFADQWQYINMGLGECLPNADMDIELAWDVTTGGITANGDTIVICVIDSGIDTDHEDLVTNLWVNHHEIPDNNIDDDNNGFIDDVFGWNASQQNDNINGGSHGTAVAGIIGAKGNNGIGVAGINWDIKVMVVRGGSSNEALVLQAYAYPLIARQLYNATNGDKGAFVVATNASWGTNFGQAADAPLWCAFYDSLGVAGVLNCGATANLDINVDTEGDLPTTCPSDFLIGVTNIDCTDTKVISAGYGVTHIDLGAYGANTYTTTSNSGYNGFGGTSGATPHVAGTIGLLYSIPCESFANLATNDPAGAALLAKAYIMQGVTPNESLDSITVSGGRLNVYNTIALAMENCSTCPFPSSVQVNNSTDTQATLSWIPSEPSLVVNIRYRVAGSPTWTVLANNANDSLTIENLMPCTNYEYQVETICQTETSGFSNSFFFETDGCCEPPSTFTEVETMPNTITLAWNSVLAATQGYTVRYRSEAALTWTLVNTADTEYTLTNLEQCTDYLVQVRGICTDGPTAYGDTLRYTSGGCGLCIEGEYCVSEGTNTSDEWIDSVEFGDLLNNSGNDNGYAFFSQTGGTFGVGESYDIRLTPGFSGNPFYEYFRVWIDYDGNTVFDEDELVFESPEPSDSTVAGVVTIPSEVPIGGKRMRVSMKFTGQNYVNLPAEACDASFEYGEVEDYCIEIGVVSAKDLVFAENIRIVPNPFWEAVQVSFETPKNDDFQIHLFDGQGKSVYSHQLNGIGDKIQHTLLGLQDLPKGIYLLHITSKNGFFTQKIIKQ